MKVFKLQVVKKDKKKVTVEIQADTLDDAKELCLKWYGENSLIKIKEKNEVHSGDLAS